MSKKVDTSPEQGQAPSAPLSELARAVVALVGRAAEPLTETQIRDRLPFHRGAPSLASLQAGEIARAIAELEAAGRLRPEITEPPRHPPRYVAIAATAQGAALSGIACEVLGLIQSAIGGPPTLDRLVELVLERNGQAPTADPAVRHVVRAAVDELEARAFVAANGDKPPRYIAQPTAPEFVVSVDELLARAEVGRAVDEVAASEPFDTVVRILADAGEPMTFDGIVDAVDVALRSHFVTAAMLNFVGGAKAFVRVALDKLTADGRVEAQLEQVPGLYRLVDAARGVPVDELLARAGNAGATARLVGRAVDELERTRRAVARVLADAEEPLSVDFIVASIGARTLGGWGAAQKAVEQALEVLQSREWVYPVAREPGAPARYIAHPLRRSYPLGAARVVASETGAQRAEREYTEYKRKTRERNVEHLADVLERSPDPLTFDDMVDRLVWLGDLSDDDRVRVVGDAVAELVRTGRARNVGAAAGDTTGTPRFSPVRKPATTSADVPDAALVSILARTLDGARTLAECTHVEQLHVDAAKETRARRAGRRVRRLRGGQARGASVAAASARRAARARPLGQGERVSGRRRFVTSPVWRRGGKLSPLQGAVLAELAAAKRARGGWVAAPTSRLARTLGARRTSVLRAARELCALGLVEIKRAQDLERHVGRSRPLPVGHANRYRLTPDGAAYKAVQA